MTSFERMGSSQRKATSLSTPARGGLLQRKCACGSHAAGGGACHDCREEPRFDLRTRRLGGPRGFVHEEEEANRIAAVVTSTSWRPAGDSRPRIEPVLGYSAGAAAELPASIGRALASSGRPLEPPLREEMEQRFGHDFSRVRVHAGAEAEQSARDVNAEAYTIGHDIVFGAGRFAPGTRPGQGLIAHELTHVVQQQGRQVSVQRAPQAGGASPGVTIGAIDVRSLDPNCQYQPGEVARSETAKGVLDYDIEQGEFLGIDPPDAVVIADFQVGVGRLRPSTASLFRTYWLPTFDPSVRSSLEIVGYSDCVGWESRNGPLREQRAQAVGRLLPGVAARAAPMEEYPVPNTSERGRALNRSAIIRSRPKPPPPPPPPRRHEATIMLEEPPTKDCSSEQRRQLAIAFPAARMMAERALAAVGSQRKGPVITFLLERYFGPTALGYLAEIRAGYTKILSNWADWDPRFDCEQTEGSCASDDPHSVTLAYVRKRTPVFSPPYRYGSVHVCPAAFATPGNMQLLSSTVLHELAHRIGDKSDRRYCEPSQGWCESLSTRIAVDNADSYSEFAREIFNVSL